MAIVNNPHSASPKEIQKSRAVFSAPFPVGAPGGRGAGTRPQFACRIFSASLQYFSPLDLTRSILSAADLKADAALRRASSLPLTTSCALKACTEGISGGLETVVALREPTGSSGIVEVCGAVARRTDRRSRAWDISPYATLDKVLEKLKGRTNRRTVAVEVSPFASAVVAQES